jgi:hypothetical protein
MPGAMLGATASASPLSTTTRVSPTKMSIATARKNTTTKAGIPARLSHTPITTSPTHIPQNANLYDTVSCSSMRCAAPPCGFPPLILSHTSPRYRLAAHMFDAKRAKSAPIPRCAKAGVCAP